MRWLARVSALFVCLLVAGYAAAWVVLIKVGNRLTFRQLDLKPGMKVVDVGCGAGRVTLPLARRVAPTGEVLGIDVQAKKVRKAEQRARIEGIENVRFEVAGAGEGRLARENFDRVLLVTVLGEMSDRPAALAEIFQALKPGGILTITEGFLDPHYQNQVRVRELARVAGFVEESCRGNRLLYTMNLLKPPTT